MKNSESNTNLPNIDSLWNYDDLSATEEKFRALLPKAKASGDNTHYAELLTQLARTQSLNGDFAEAHAILDSVQNILKTEDIPLVKIRYLLERGRTYNSANKKEMAIPLFKEAFELAQKNKADFYAIDAAHMLGIAEKPDQQLRWNLKAVELTEKSNEHRAKKWLGPLYNNIGWTYHDKGDYREAMHFFEKSLEWREAQNDQKGAFIAKWCIARNYRSMNEIEAALDIQEALLSEMKADSSKTDPYVYEELGECHLLKKDSTSARRYFKLAYAILSKDKWMQNNEPQRLERMLELSGNQK